IAADIHNQSAAGGLAGQTGTGPAGCDGQFMLPRVVNNVDNVIDIIGEGNDLRQLFVAGGIGCIKPARLFISVKFNSSSRGCSIHKSVIYEYLDAFARSKDNLTKNDRSASALDFH